MAKINVLTIPADSGEEFLGHFADRLGNVEDVDGFLGLDVLRPMTTGTPLVIAWTAPRAEPRPAPPRTCSTRRAWSD